MRWCVLVVCVLLVCVSCGGGEETSEEDHDRSEATLPHTPSDGSETSATTTANTEKRDAGLGLTGPAREATTSTTEPPRVTTTTTTPKLEQEYPLFVEGPAPQWPFRGIVQLWSSSDYPLGWDDWVLRYWSWDESAESYPKELLPAEAREYLDRREAHKAEAYSEVPVTGLEIECLGRIIMVVDTERGIEIGGIDGAANSAFRIPWGGTAQRIDTPSEELIEWERERPSNVAVRVEGDQIHIDTGTQQHSYAMHDPIRSNGPRWAAQARYDGELFLLMVYPAHLPCYTGVTWISLAETGEFVTCGANTAATLFVAPEPPAGELILPDPDTMGTYLSCAPQLNLTHLPFTQDRQLVTGLSR